MAVVGSLREHRVVRAGPARRLAESRWGRGSGWRSQRSSVAGGTRCPGTCFVGVCGDGRVGWSGAVDCGLGRDGGRGQVGSFIRGSSGLHVYRVWKVTTGLTLDRARQLVGTSGRGGPGLPWTGRSLRAEDTSWAGAGPGAAVGVDRWQGWTWAFLACVFIACRRVQLADLACGSWCGWEGGDNRGLRGRGAWRRAMRWG